MNDTNVLTIAIGFSVLFSLAGAWLVLQLLYTRVMLKKERSRSYCLFLHLGETQAALQTALGGGWQLADPDKDVFFLPESAILSYTDETTGGRQEQTRRNARTSIYVNNELLARIMDSERRGLPIAFRGLEWRMVEVGQSRICYGDRCHLGEDPTMDLRLVTYADREG